MKRDPTEWHALAWALGETAASHPMSDRERQLTAGIYAQVPGGVDHARRNGKLPPGMTAARGAEIGLRARVHERGIDSELSEKERSCSTRSRRRGDVCRVRAAFVAVLH